MAGVITTGNHPKALWPGVHAWWGREYTEYKAEWKDIYDVETSEKAYEEDVEATGFGLVPQKAQGESVTFDSEAQGTVTRYTHVVYGMGYIVTQEEQEDNKYMEVSKRRVRALAFSMRQTEEVVGANVLNRAFNTSYTGGDAKALIVSDHPALNGTQSNVLAVAADLSEASLEDMIIQMAGATNSRGLRIKIMPRKLIVSSSDAFNAERILRSSLQSGTANNDVNAIKSMGLLPDGAVVNHFLTDADAWFLKSDVPNGLIRFNRRATAFTNDSDFDTANLKAKATTRFSVGWTDWRCMYGSPGA